MAIRPCAGGAGFRRSAEQGARDVALVKEQFNQISPENDLKWQLVHPRESKDGFDFGLADAFVNFGLSYRVEGVDTDWRWLPQQFDASILSDECIAPGQAHFTGAFVGMACQDLAGTGTPADFDFFEYHDSTFA